MTLSRACIPYGAYWSTPFCRWQGALSGAHALELAARTAKDVLARKGIAPESFDGVVLGMTVPQRGAFYGAPWLAGLMGAPGAAGPTVSQACATGARALATAALDVETGQRACVLAVTADRTSNGPHLYYPSPRGPGGRGDAEDWVWDNFMRDPFADNAMIETAEAVAREAGVSREEQDELCLLRHEQYAAALAGDRAFQRRYLAPVRLPGRRGETAVVDRDEGPRSVTAAALAALAPVKDGGTITSGTQTYPADGNAGVVVCTEERARALAGAGGPIVRILGFGEARVERGRMPAATVPAAKRALEQAGVPQSALDAVTTHNPFALSDVYFCRRTGVRPEAMNRYGSSLVWGHPQAPTGTRAMIELVEELAARGGGHGLFAGCAAGDTAMAVVLRVETP